MKFLNIKVIALVLLMLFTFNGCTNLKLKQAVADANDPKVVKAYETKINEVVKIVQADPNYVRIPLDTKEDADWFLTQSFLYWDKKNSRDEFIAEGVKRFPDYKSSFEYLADRIKQD